MSPYLPALTKAAEPWPESSEASGAARGTRGRRGGARPRGTYRSAGTL